MFTSSGRGNEDLMGGNHVEDGGDSDLSFPRRFAILSAMLLGVDLAVCEYPEDGRHMLKRLGSVCLPYSLSLEMARCLDIIDRPSCVSGQGGPGPFASLFLH